MYLQYLASVSTLLLIGAAGCAEHRIDAAWPVPRPLGSDFKTYRPAVELAPDASGLPKFDELTGTIGLRDALSAALLRNPELAAFSWEVRAGEARTLQASLPPNPEIEIEIEEIRTSSGSGGTTKRTTIGSDGSFEIEKETEEGPPTGFSGAEYTITLSQLIELGGKRSKRIRLATLERDLAGWNYETKRIDVLTEVTKAFVEVLATQERVALANKLVGLSEKLLSTVDERVKAGKASPLEQTKAKVILSTSRIESEQAGRNLKAARKRLAATWGSSSPRFEKTQGRFDLIKPIPSAEQLTILISQNPDIIRWAAEVDQRQAAIELEKAKRIPDLTLGGGIQYFGETGDTAIILGASMPLPLFDRNQGGIKEAGYMRIKATEERRAAEVRIRTALAEAYQSLASASSNSTGLKNDVLPGAQKAFDAASEGYRLGKFSYLDVLDAQRTLFQAKGQYIEALSAYHKAIADVERLIGQRIDAIETIQQL